MRQLVFVILLVLSGMNSYAQDHKKIEIPTVVKATFAKSYPKAKDIEWEMEGKQYEVNFELGKTDWSALYDAQGNLLETEEEIASTLLPLSVLDYMKSHYKNVKIDETSRITDAGGVVTFEVEVNDIDLIFDRNGNLLNTEETHKD